MRVTRSIAEFRDWRRELGALPGRLGYVPTMGALHHGHTTLIRRAGTTADLVAVSIFVNPLQFGPNEDYARYPRRTDADLEVCEANGVDVVFLPTVAELYPAGRQISVSAGPIGSVLEGESRPGHFDGVLTVVLKLFNIIRPDVAVFGRKDAQQLACIQRMVTDLNLDLELLGVETVRDADGLAVSSRNAYLAPPERQLALSLSAALTAAAQQASAPSALAAARAVLDRAAQDPAFQLDYLSLVQPQTFTEVPDDYSGPATMLVAARVGTTRLIDNATVTCQPVGADD